MCGNISWPLCGNTSSKKIKFDGKIVYSVHISIILIKNYIRIKNIVQDKTLKIFPMADEPTTFASIALSEWCL